MSCQVSSHRRDVLYGILHGTHTLQHLRYLALHRSGILCAALQRTAGLRRVVARRQLTRQLAVARDPLVELILCIPHIPPERVPLCARHGLYRLSCYS